MRARSFAARLAEYGVVVGGGAWSDASRSARSLALWTVDAKIRKEGESILDELRVGGVVGAGEVSLGAPRGWGVWQALGKKFGDADGTVPCGSPVEDEGFGREEQSPFGVGDGGSLGESAMQGEETPSDGDGIL